MKYIIKTRDPIQKHQVEGYVGKRNNPKRVVPAIAGARVFESLADARKYITSASNFSINTKYTVVEVDEKELFEAKLKDADNDNLYP